MELFSECAYSLTYIQGIDLKDIELVVQWKVTCDPCILWQRFGRAARDKCLQATGLLFVESKDCDLVEEPKTCKRKAVEEGDKAHPQLKRPKKKERPLPMVLAEGEGAEGRFWKARVAIYHEPVSDGKIEKGNVNPVLDDVINAEARGIGCWRKPFQKYFENDKLHGLFVLSQIYCSLTSHRWSHMRQRRERNMPALLPNNSTTLLRPLQSRRTRKQVCCLPRKTEKSATSINYETVRTLQGQQNASETA